MSGSRVKVRRELRTSITRRQRNKRRQALNEKRRRGRRTSIGAIIGTTVTIPKHTDLAEASAEQLAEEAARTLDESNLGYDRSAGDNVGEDERTQYAKEMRAMKKAMKRMQKRWSHITTPPRRSLVAMFEGDEDSELDNDEVDKTEMESGNELTDVTVASESEEPESEDKAFIKPDNEALTDPDYVPTDIEEFDSDSRPKPLSLSGLETPRRGGC